MQTTRGISSLIASKIALAANGGGTYMTLASGLRAFLA
jgi:hypothetical protein